MWLRPAPAPKEVRWIVWCFIVLAVLQLLVGILLMLHRAEVLDTTRQAKPALTQNQLDYTVNSTVYGGAVVHLIIAVLYVWIAMKIGRGRNWARIVGSAFVILAIFGGLAFLLSASSTIPEEQGQVAAEQLLSGVISLLAVGLLWLPRSSRDFFRTGNASAR